MRRILRVAAVGLAATCAMTALACGYCIEDRVAAVYDQKVVDAAARGHRTVAFFSIEGEVRDDAASKRAVGAALRAAGAAGGSSRVALVNAACSMAYDPSRTSLEAVVTAANRPLASRGLALAPLRVIDAGGRLREP